MAASSNSPTPLSFAGGTPPSGPSASETLLLLPAGAQTSVSDSLASLVRGFVDGLGVTVLVVDARFPEQTAPDAGRPGFAELAAGLATVPACCQDAGTHWRIGPGATALDLPMRQLSAKCGAAVSALAGVRDVVVIVAPSLENSRLGQVMAGAVDRVLVLVEGRATLRSSLDFCREALAAAGARRVEAILREEPNWIEVQVRRCSAWLRSRRRSS